MAEQAENHNRTIFFRKVDVFFDFNELWNILKSWIASISKMNTLIFQSYQMSRWSNEWKMFIFEYLTHSIYKHLSVFVCMCIYFNI